MNECTFYGEICKSCPTTLLKKRDMEVEVFNKKRKTVKCPNCKKKYRAVIDAMSNFYVCPHCACIGNLPIKYRIKYGNCYDPTIKAIIDYKKKTEGMNMNECTHKQEGKKCPYEQEPEIGMVYPEPMPASFSIKPPQWG